MTEQKSERWLLLNAIECWLYYFPQHQWAAQYKGLRDVLQQAVANETETKEEEPIKEEIQKPQGRRTAAKATNKNT
jgi:hypothetical protein